MTVSIPIIQSHLKICEKHAKRLRWAIKKIKPTLPFTVAVLKDLSEEQVALVDQFILRFSKLQDLMGTQLFPALLELSEEPGQYETFIDKLNRLEKMRVIPSARDWQQLRMLRNAFAHDYPEDSEIQVKTLNETFQSTAKLFKILRVCKSFSTRFINRIRSRSTT